MMKKPFFLLMYFIFFLSLFCAAQQRPFILVIDAGHGGKDPGKPRGSTSLLHEKDLNLGIALKLGKYVQDNLSEVKVIFTRTEDKFLELEDRVAIANENKADCFISVHCNSTFVRSIQGTEMHIYSHKMKASHQLAMFIDEEMRLRAKRKSKGIIDAARRGRNLYVTQYTEMPSVLVEAGYLTNPVEEKFLNSEEGQVIIASAIYRGVKSYIQSKRPVDNRSTIYKVQILASKRPIDIESKVFEELEEKVIQTEGTVTEKYRYKYLIGREYEQERAEELARKVEKLGFKGAFVVKVD